LTPGIVVAHGLFNTTPLPAEQRLHPQHMAIAADGAVELLEPGSTRAPRAPPGSIALGDSTLNVFIPALALFYLVFIIIWFLDLLVTHIPPLLFCFFFFLIVVSAITFGFFFPVV